MRTGSCGSSVTLLYATQVFFAIGPGAPTPAHVRRWIEATGEFEALSALAGYAYEHPKIRFPEVSGGEPCFEAEDLATRCCRRPLRP